MLVDETQVFNLMDTNGRRKDVVNALQIYLEILDEIQQESHNMKWQTFPEGLSQFMFYSKAVDYCSDVFKTHKDYDWFTDILENDDIRNTFFNLDQIRLMVQLGPEYESFIAVLDKSIEARSRHYTSTLVKLGLVDKNRRITRVGRSVLSNENVKRDNFERLLPIDNINLLYLRQLLKLKIIAKNDKKSFYSPMMLAIYLLLQYDYVTINDFKNIIQSQSPFKPIKDIDGMILNFLNKNIEMDIDEDIPEVLSSNALITRDTFKEFFFNSKQKASQDIYFDFYQLLHNFVYKTNEDNLLGMLNFYIEHKDMLNKAFGYGKNLFIVDKLNLCSISKFFEQNDLDIFSGNLNTNLYKRFLISKKMDVVREYSDTTIRLMRITGIIKFKNGIVELAYKDVFKELFKYINLKKFIFGKLKNDISVEQYEENFDSYMGTNMSISSIFNINNLLLEKIIIFLSRKYNAHNLIELSMTLSNEKQREFIDHIDKKYPKQKVIEILSLISDRRNDRIIKEMVNPDATVPTIYEYIVAIAWYYFSNKDFDILNSLNLSLNADLEPETHAGGGAGDIVIEYEEKVIMLEVTLMNKQAQKRGEWEPVLRHSINLKIEKEPKDVMTFFIADELDMNTINIWRAVSSVPLQSSNDPSKITDNVMIMPLQNSELIKLIEEEKGVHTLMTSVKVSYDMVIRDFDSKWRDKILDIV